MTATAAIPQPIRVLDAFHARRFLQKPLLFGDQCQIEARNLMVLYDEATERMKPWAKSGDDWQGVLDGRYDVDSLDYLTLGELRDFIEWLKEGED